MNTNLYPRGYPRDYYSEEELGRAYECYVAGYFERVLHCVVVHQGKCLGIKDGGIDLVALTPDTTYLVQCKHYRASSQIHGKHVSQLRGDANVFAAEFPSAKNITPMLVAHCHFAEDALKNSKVNSVQLLHLPFQPETIPYPNGGNYIDYLGSAYHERLYGLIYKEQIIRKPAPPEPENKVVEADQPPVIANQSLVAANQKAVETEHTAVKAERISVKIEDDCIESGSQLSFYEEYAVQRGFLYYLFAYRKDPEDYAPQPSYESNQTSLPMNILSFLVWAFALLTFISVSSAHRGSDFLYRIAAIASEYLSGIIDTAVCFFRGRKKTLVISLCIVWALLTCIGYIQENGQSVEPVRSVSSPTEVPTTSSASSKIPENGGYYGYRFATFPNKERPSSVTVTTPRDGNYYCLVFADADKPQYKYFAVFVHPNSKVTVDVPAIDNLCLYITYGNTWYGYQQYFGSHGLWSTSDSVYDFGTYTYTLSLKEVAGGNWETEDIDAAQVPFLD